MNALILLPLVPEGARPPEGFSRKEWRRGTDRYRFAIVTFGPIRRIYKLEGPPDLYDWPAEGELQFKRS